MERGTRVRYVGISVNIAKPGELGTVIGPGRHKRGDVEMVEVAWDAGSTSHYWPSELGPVAAQVTA